MKTPPLFQYTATAPEDILVARWWSRMFADGDVDRLFTRDARTLAGLLRIIAPPKVMFYAADANGDLWYAAWFEQLFSSLVAGMWIRRDRRSAPGALAAWLETLHAALEVSPTVLGITKHVNLLRSHRKIGYTVLGSVPGMWDGEDAWVVMLTREAFAKTWTRYRRAKPADMIDRTGYESADAARQRAESLNGIVSR